VSCPAATYAGCAGTATLKLPGTRSPAFSIAPGGRTDIRFRPTKGGLQALKRRRWLWITIKAHDGASQSRAGRWKLAARS
jgi:hypothetical protein